MLPFKKTQHVKLRLSERIIPANLFYAKCQLSERKSNKDLNPQTDKENTDNK